MTTTNTAAYYQSRVDQTGGGGGGGSGVRYVPSVHAACTVPTLYQVPFVKDAKMSLQKTFELDFDSGALDWTESLKRLYNHAN